MTELARKYGLAEGVILQYILEYDSGRYEWDEPIDIEISSLEKYLHLKEDEIYTVLNGMVTNGILEYEPIVYNNEPYIAIIKYLNKTGRIIRR